MRRFSSLRTIGTLALAATLGGCTCAALDVDSRSYACADHASCGEGFVCFKGRCASAGAARDAGCTGEPAEVCSDGLDNDCDGATDCAEEACDGTACGSIGVCSGGRCACPPAPSCDSTQYCREGRCAPKEPIGASCLAAGDCSSGRCADGFCCEVACAGECDTCGGPSPGTCTLRVAGSPGDPSCDRYLCSGASASCPRSCSADGQCAPGNFCEASACVQKRAVGAACAGANQCASGHCADGFCCDAACSGGCDRCDLVPGRCTPYPAGSAGAPSCAPYVCPGDAGVCPSACAGDTQCAAGSFCSSGSACVPKLPQGSACGANSHCQSDRCVDSFCCDGPCGGQCDTCASPTPGTCALRPPGASGSPGCGAYLCSGSAATCPTACSDDAQCSPGNYCQGSSCVPKRALGAGCASSNQCASGHCSDAVCCGTACSGQCDECASVPGTCNLAAARAPGAPTCSPYVCSGAAASCPQSCQSDAACASTHYCGAGLTCVPKLSNGAGCTAANQCSSGFCADNVCCVSACAGQCDRCDQTPGTCTVLGLGAAGSPSCTPFACNGSLASCPGSCTGDAGCAPGFACTGGLCAGLIRDRLRDDFNDNTFDTGLWTSGISPAGSATIAEQNQHLEFGTVPNVATDAFVASVATYDARASSVRVRLGTSATGYGTIWQQVYLEDGGGRRAGFTLLTNSLVPFTYDPGGGNNSLPGTVIGAGSNLHVRIRELNNNTTWEYSTDGSNFTPLASQANTLNMASVRWYMRFLVTGAGVGGTLTVAMDDVNVP